MENERRTNRSCAIACLWVAAVCALICLIGLTGALFLDRRWMAFYGVHDLRRRSLRHLDAKAVEKTVLHRANAHERGAERQIGGRRQN